MRGLGEAPICVNSSSAFLQQEQKGKLNAGTGTCSFRVGRGVEVLVVAKKAVVNCLKR